MEELQKQILLKQFQMKINAALAKSKIKTCNDFDFTSNAAFKQEVSPKPIF
jgi:hypothetical protein